MLAQNFLSHDVLGISLDEQAALIKVLGMLERGELVHTDAMMHENGFNMGRIAKQSSCGTVACICGWAQILSPGVFPTFQNENLSWESQPQALIDLFKFGADLWSLFKITDGQAAIALRNYLTTGEPRWEEALAA